MQSSSLQHLVDDDTHARASVFPAPQEEEALGDRPSHSPHSDGSDYSSEEEWFGGWEEGEQEKYGIEDAYVARKVIAREDSNFCTDGLLASYCTRRWFLVVLCGYVVVQGAVVTGLFSSSVSSMQRRFDMTSLQIGLLAATYDVVVLLLAPLVGFYGSRRHQPRQLSYGLLTLCVGVVCFVMPHFLSDDYNPVPQSQEMCRFSRATCLAAASDASGLSWWFFLGMVLIAIGSTPLWSLGPSYLDSIVPKAKLPVYLGWFYVCGAIGPALGFGMSAGLLRVWTEFPDDAPSPPMTAGSSEANEPLDADDTEWVGAWWLGFGIMVIPGVYFAALMFLFPKYLPGTQRIRDFNRAEYSMGVTRRVTLQTMSAEENLEEAFRRHERGEFVKTVKKTLRNRAFVFNCLGQAMEAFSVAGFAVFLPKASESVFRFSASEASAAVGLVLIFGGITGVFLGAYYVHTQNLTPVRTARFAYKMSVFCFIFLFAFALGCDNVNLSTHTGGKGLPASCNAGCGCNDDVYMPTCGANGVTYRSPCEAGCLVQSGVNADRYFNCSCVEQTPGGDFGHDAEIGRCNVASGRCDVQKVVFLVLLFFIMAFTLAVQVPAVSVVLRALPQEDRGVGLGIQNVIFRLLGTIPGPILFGVFIDLTCIVDNCNDGGQCREYDIDKLRLAFLLLALLPKALSILSFGLSWRYFRQPAFDREDDLYAAVDWDGSGGVTLEEVIEFIKDEHFLGNPLFKGIENEIETWSEGFFNKIDENNDGEISSAELKRYCDRAPPQVASCVARALTQESREKLLDNIFKWLDRDGDGKVSKGELRYWLRTEQSWQTHIRAKAMGDEDSRRKVEDAILRQIDFFEDDNIERQELENFFRDWPIRKLRLFTQDAHKWRRVRVLITRTEHAKSARWWCCEY